MSWATSEGRCDSLYPLFSAEGWFTLSHPTPTSQGAPGLLSLRRGVQEAAAIVGQDRARAMVIDTPKAILENLLVDIEPPVRVSERKTWWRFWGELAGLAAPSGAGPPSPVLDSRTCPPPTLKLKGPTHAPSIRVGAVRVWPHAGVALRNSTRTLATSSLIPKGFTM